MTDRLPSWIHTYPGLWTDEMLARYDPEGWAEIQAMQAERDAARSAALYFDLYQQATGEFLEYACGRALT